MAVLLPAVGVAGQGRPQNDCCDGAPVLSTYVGTGEPGIVEEGQKHYRAAIAEPYGLASDAAGNLYFSDYENNRVGRVDAATGAVTTLADVLAPQGLALDRRGTLYVGTMLGEVWRVDLATGRTEVFAGGGTLQEASGDARSLALGAPAGVAVDHAGTLYIADSNLHAVFRMDPGTRQLEVVAGQRGTQGFAGDGGSATDALLNGPSAMAVDRDRTLYIADADNHVIRVVDPADGSIRTLAGTPGEKGYSGDGAADGIRFNWPQDLQFNGPQSLLIADVLNHRVRELDLATGVVRTVAGTGPGEYGAENAVAVDATLPTPVGLAVGPAGEIFVSSARGHRVFRIGAAFTAPPPWYLSPWTWLAALLALGALLYGSAELRAYQLRARARALEAEVEQRTRVLAEQQATVARQAGRLRRLAASRQQLLTRVSAEFQAPLEEIRQTIGPSREGAVTPAQLDYLDVVERNSSRLLRLVDHMRGLTGTGGRNDEDSGPVAALPVIHGLLDSLEPVAAEHGVAVVRGRLEDLTLESSADAFESISVNLVSNAIKYTPAGGSVTVNLEAQSGKGVLTVSDTGCGIPRDDQQRIFQPFERAHDEGERIPGSGLGLAIVQEQAEACGARVELESEPGLGSTFRVHLPLAAPGREAGERSSRRKATLAEREAMAMKTGAGRTVEAQGATGPVATVLVVEDNPDMRRYITGVLAAQFRCLETDDGHQAFAMALREVPDVVVSDVMLPGQDGFALCRSIRHDERSCHIPIVLLTALGDSDHRLSGFAELADEYLAKPFNERELLLRVRNLMDLRAMLQRRFARDLRFERSLPEGLGERDRAFLEKLGHLLDARHRDPTLELRSMASALAVSERQLQRKLKALTGLTPGECLRDYRLQRAQERLAEGGLAGEVASESGFASHAHFSACFRARFGYPPSEARERARRRA